MKKHNQAIKFAPCGRRTLVPRAVYGGRFKQDKLIMEVRRVEQEEIGKVLALIDQYDRPTTQHPGPKRIKEIYTAIVASGGCIVGAFGEGEQLLGTCTVNICPNLSWSGRPYGMIENVVVSVDHRNLGIGKKILSYAVAYAEQAGCYKAALMSGSKDPAVCKFYESAGFSPSKQGYQVRFNA